jgi:hypothetical protein
MPELISRVSAGEEENLWSPLSNKIDIHWLASMCAFVINASGMFNRELLLQLDEIKLPNWLSYYAAGGFTNLYLHLADRPHLSSISVKLGNENYVISRDYLRSINGKRTTSIVSAAGKKEAGEDIEEIVLSFPKDEELEIAMCAVAGMYNSERASALYVNSCLSPASVPPVFSLPVSDKLILKINSTLRIIPYSPTKKATGRITKLDYPHRSICLESVKTQSTDTDANKSIEMLIPQEFMENPLFLNELMDSWIRQSFVTVDFKTFEYPPYDDFDSPRNYGNHYSYMLLKLN